MSFFFSFEFFTWNALDTQPGPWFEPASQMQLEISCRARLHGAECTWAVVSEPPATEPNRAEISRLNAQLGELGPPRRLPGLDSPQLGEVTELLPISGDNAVMATTSMIFEECASTGSLLRL